MRDTQLAPARQGALSIQEVWKDFGALSVLKGVDLDVSAGEVVSLIGAKSSCCPVCANPLIGHGRN